MNLIKAQKMSLIFGCWKCIVGNVKYRVRSFGSHRSLQFLLYGYFWLS